MKNKFKIYFTQLNRKGVLSSPPSPIQNNTEAEVIMTTETKEKAKTKTSSQKKTDKKELRQLEQKALEIWRKRDKERVGPLKFKATGKNSVIHKEKNPDKFGPQLLETTGSTDADFSGTILTQVTSTLHLKDNESTANFTAALMHGLKPRDETEGILIAQMAGTHNLIMEYMSKAMIPGQYLEAADDYTNRAYKLMNIFLKQIETLEKYRGKGAQQKVIVEHVHIHEGGQAVVGHIESKPRGRGMIKKNKAKPREKRRGWLKYNNPPGDFMKAPRCGAKTRKGMPCRAPSMKNGRCRLHGGKSTGPKSPEGIERIRQAHLKHGEYTKEAIASRKEFNALMKQLRGTLIEINDNHKKIDIKI